VQRRGQSDLSYSNLAYQLQLVVATTLGDLTMRKPTVAFAFVVTAAAAFGVAGPLPRATADRTPHAAIADRTHPAEELASGAELFTQNCSACHGAKGNGDGPAAVALNPKPRKLADGATMSKISDETIVATIKKGGQAMGKSPVMPAFTQLDDAAVKALLLHIRTLCGCSYTK